MACDRSGSRNCTEDAADALRGGAVGAFGADFGYRLELGDDLSPKRCKTFRFDLADRSAG